MSADVLSTAAHLYEGHSTSWETIMWADAKRDGRPADYRWRPLQKFCNSIHVPRRKVWLTLAAGVRAQGSQYRRTQDLDGKWTLHQAKLRQGAKDPENVYIVCQCRRRPKFGWPPVSDVAAVTKARRKTRWNLLGCPNSWTDLSRKCAEVRHTVQTRGEDIVA